MILVTVGTGLAFDELIEIVDQAAGAGALKGEDVVFQTGHGQYEPVNGQSFISLPNLRPVMREASLIICHGGIGTVFECLLLEKPFIAVPNQAVADNHQLLFLRALAERIPIIWTDDPAAVPNLIRAHERRPIAFSRQDTLCGEVIGYLSRLKRYAGIR
jgi:beta-1,4-N-acetylglucosaminyltransferase